MEVTYENVEKNIHFITTISISTGYRHFEVICMHKTLQHYEMRKSNRKVNFTKNRWASLFSRGRLKISKCSISLAWVGECSKSKVTPLLLHTIIYVSKYFQGLFLRSQGVTIFIYIQIVVTLQFLPGEINLMI